VRRVLVHSFRPQIWLHRKYIQSSGRRMTMCAPWTRGTSRAGTGRNALALVDHEVY
jgi:hypothetical protein